MLQKKTDIAVVIVEDHSIVVEGLCSILQNAEGIRISGTFMDGGSALAFLDANAVDVVLLDISLPEMSGIEVCKAIKAKHPDTRVIALTNHTEKSVIREMLENGADGYLLKNTSKKDLISAIFQVLDNQFTMNSEVQKILFAPSAKSTDVPRLTKREKEILQLVSEGATTAAIAAQLFVSPQTVETHRRNLMQKFKVNNSSALVRKAIAQQIIQ
ncbi:two component transcriptional regulator, LuxR family [Chitinophaga rupis]|uniref:Two component transcriptional regulator, LuxR family n=1 Tax=Chitinophaga rupis TaxID=573321 RepID=A0A1H7YBD6_9BACT|nr:response regulator transcription factor [Chitinophaga rupis]SEM43184.1 two component transcriptional regulator, LuxR family [Chitinophaga rupis]